MNTKKLALLFVVVFITIFVTDYLIHCVALKSLYQSTAYLWRSENGMKRYMAQMMLGRALIALFFSLIFLQGYKGKGVIEGLRFGLLLMGLYAGQHLIMYSVAPYKFSLVFAWTILGGIQAMIAGVLCTYVMEKKFK